MVFGKNQAGTAAEKEEYSFMGKDVTFEGVLTVEGNVQIDGRVKGELRTTGTLTIGEHAIINGNVLAGTLIMSGKIEGNVIASEKIKILKPGILIGDIRTRAISIEAGAHFHGQSDMGYDTQTESHGGASKNVHALPVSRRNQRAKND
ncbi:MAG: polymer-forming cytoskeletal protein [Nitrospiraceae bacterium]|nr:polymer-forming cytoskeletal protein [Nitrospiraceae bacterium]